MSDQQKQYQNGMEVREGRLVPVNEGVSRGSLEFEDLANEKHNQLDYPLRKPEEDERWAINTVRIWVGIDIAVLLFIFTMLVLGVIFD